MVHTIFFIVLTVLLVIAIVLIATKKLKVDHTFDKTNQLIRDEFQRSREEAASAAKNQREELSKSLELFKERFESNVKSLNDLIQNRFESFAQKQKELDQDAEQRITQVREMVEVRLKNIREDNTNQLNEMRKTVDEKLQKTLNERLSQSFETVGHQLKAVQQGLGEMKTLASDVGGLKKVLSNVKMRGGIGEVQLAMLLEQILAPDQYAANVNTKQNSQALVEYAIKLPGKDDAKSVIWIPIDAKFPKDVYEKLQDAYETADQHQILSAQKALEYTIKKMAKDIHEKYIDPPNTTDFAIMFLPFESIYAEVLRKVALFEELRRDYKTIVAGPTTLAAILNSLQMGFKTLAIQKRSGEVWNVLATVKKEFENFGGMMEKAQKNIQTGLNQLDDVMGKRTRAIQRSLKEVTTLKESHVDTVASELTQDTEQR